MGGWWRNSSWGCHLASSTDEIITAIAFPERGGIEAGQDENERILVARWERILARTDLTPLQRLTAEREYAKFRGSRQDPAEGNGRLFVETAQAQASKIIKGAVGGLFDEFLPLTLTAIALIAFVLFLRFAPSKT